MAKHFKILTLFFLTKASLFAQVNYSTKVFHKHIQICHFVGTTEEDYVIELNPDSTIKITRYTSNYQNQHNSVIRQAYSGSYSKVGDTIKVKFINHSSTTKSKLKQAKSFYSAGEADTLFDPLRFFQYPPSVYIMSADKIMSIDGLFPTLANSTATNIMLLESKFIYLDKNSVYKKEVFGLTR